MPDSATILFNHFCGNSGPVSRGLLHGLHALVAVNSRDTIIRNKANPDLEKCFDPYSAGTGSFNAICATHAWILFVQRQFAWLNLKRIIHALA